VEAFQFTEAGGSCILSTPAGTTVSIQTPEQTVTGDTGRGSGPSGGSVSAPAAQKADQTQEAQGSQATAPSPLFLSYSDLDADHPYRDAVEWMLSAGLMAGFGDGTFGPDRTLTRAQLAQILYSAAGRPAAAADSSLPDVPAQAWYAAPVLWSVQAGISAGYGDGRFGPGDCVTREQLAVMLWRYAGSPTPTLTKLDYPDAADASSWAQTALRWAGETGVLDGVSQGSLSPKAQATRAQAAQMIANLLSRASA
jgi:hypothetical protein